MTTIAGRLRDQAGGGGLAARLGGDEFVIVAPFDREDDLIGWLSATVANVEQPVVVSSHELMVGGTLGVALFPGDGKDPSWLADLVWMLSDGELAVPKGLEVDEHRKALADTAWAAEAYALDGWTGEAIAELGAKDVARLTAGGVEERVPVEALAVGDRFVVRPGEKIATDGRVVEGASAIDAALVTGESVPVEVTVGDAVTGATLNAGGRLVVEVTRVGSDTTLARMAPMLFVIAPFIRIAACDRD